MTFLLFFYQKILKGKLSMLELEKKTHQKQKNKEKKSTSDTKQNDLRVYTICIGNVSGRDKITVFKIFLSAITSPK